MTVVLLGDGRGNSRRESSSFLLPPQTAYAHCCVSLCLDKLPITMLMYCEVIVQYLRWLDDLISVNRPISGMRRVKNDAAAVIDAVECT